MGNCFGLCKTLNALESETLGIIQKNTRELLHKEIAIIRAELMALYADEKVKMRTMSSQGNTLSRLGKLRESDKQRRWSYCPGGEHMDQV